MADIPLSTLIVALILCLLFSAFFSGSETALMSLNRYRLRHLSRAGHRGAVIAERLLRRPDRLIGIILLGNNLFNILASSITTIIALRIGGEGAIAIATGLLTLLVLVFAEVTPKTLAALHPERIAFPAAYFYVPMLKLAYPVVWLVNGIANTLLRIFGIHPDDPTMQSISSEELRTIVVESGQLIPKRHQRMLLNILDLENATVEDVMVPRNEIMGLDLNDEWEEILEQILTSQHTRLPVYEDSIDNIVGIIHLRRFLHAQAHAPMNKEALRKVAEEPHFIPENTSLHRQIINFQNVHRRIGLVVDEYGDIQGLVALEDILEEIVGEFTSDPAQQQHEAVSEDNGSWLVNGSTNIRTLNRSMHWKLPTDGPKTINGLILEYLEQIPQPGTSIKLAGYPIEIVQTSGSAVKTVRIWPRIDST